MLAVTLQEWFFRVELSQADPTGSRENVNMSYEQLRTSLTHPMHEERDAENCGPGDAVLARS